jgi:predicted CXXCH cytochrome family protein
MRRILWLATVLAAALLSACGQDEPPAAKSAPQQVVKQEEAAKAPVTAEPAAAKVAESASGEAVPPAEVQQVTSAATETKVKPAVDGMPGDADATATAAATTVTAVQQAAAEQLAAPLKKETEAVKQRLVPDELVLEASYGNITFPHGMHAEANACQTCHGDAEPAAFGINKEIGHRLCKGCHKEQGAGPTRCGGCHVK